MRKWLIQIENKLTNTKHTLYDDGTVYGTERGQKLGVLSTETMSKLNTIINENIYMLRTQRCYYKENVFPHIVIKINDKCKNHNSIKTVGWSQSLNIENLLLNSDNYQYII